MRPTKAVLAGVAALQNLPIHQFDGYAKYKTLSGNEMIQLVFGRKLAAC